MEKQKTKRFGVLHEEAKARGITYKQVAAAAGHDVGWYNQVRKFELDPSWTDVLAMAARVGLNIDCLVGLTCRAGAVPQDCVETDRARLREEKEAKRARAAGKKATRARRLEA